MNRYLQKGLTLIEVLIGLVLVSLAIVGATTQIGALQVYHGDAIQHDAQSKVANKIMQDITYYSNTTAPTFPQSINLLSSTAISGSFSAYDTKWKTQGVSTLNSVDSASVTVSNYNSDDDHRQITVVVGDITIMKVLNVPGR